MINISFSNKSHHLPHQQALVLLVESKINENMINQSTIDNSNVNTFLKTDVFKGKYGDVQNLSTISNHELSHVILIGIGEVSALSESKLQKLGAKLYQELLKLKIRSITIKSYNLIENFNNDHLNILIASGLMTGSYKFDKYNTEMKPDDDFDQLEIITDNETVYEELISNQISLAQSIEFAKNCVNEPANVLYPESYAQKIIDEFRDLDVEIDVIGEREMKNLGMNAILGVGQGSSKESKLVVMKYLGGSNDKPLALVGKGVTFDTGGISLKPSLNMHEMKYDMAGSAAVVGTIRAIAARKAKVNVVGIVGLVENMPGGNAQKPGDVVKTMNGQTVEVLDTDAEGRLVLADAIWYAQDKFDPAIVINLATLTGAIIVALGQSYGGLFANDDDLAKELIEVGHKTGEELWRLPLCQDYEDMIKSEIADIANLGNVRAAAGSAAGAHFIQKFVKKDVKWAHLDIAGVAYKRGSSSVGATGYGVKLLDKFIKNHYES